MSGLPLLTHWPPADAKVLHFGSLEILTAFVFDVGVFLVVAGVVLMMTFSLAEEH